MSFIKILLIAINGMPDHIHILIGLKPNKALSDLVRDIKANSSRFINEKGWLNGKFEWQTGFGAFSYSHSQLTNVIHYIQNQEEHHRTKTFKEEYIEFLKLFNFTSQGSKIVFTPGGSLPPPNKNISLRAAKD